MHILSTNKEKTYEVLNKDFLVVLFIYFSRRKKPNNFIEKNVKQISKSYNYFILLLVLFYFNF